MADDAELLRRYVEEESEEAFTELVHRYFGVVYAAALRQVHDSHDAKNVVQAVFTSLARHASSLRHRSVIVGWLYTTTHYAAAKTLRANRRRQAREHEALIMDEIGGTPNREPMWEQLRPILDETMNELAEPDREAVLLRFFQGLTFAQIAGPLRVSEDGARKRVDRALDRLRASLARRGITSTPAALAAALSAQPAVAAPSGLAAAVASGAIAGGRIAALAPGTIAKITLMTTSTKVIATAAISALIAFLVGSQWGGRPAPVAALSPPAAVSGQAQMLSSLRAENQRLHAELDRLDTEIATATVKNAELAAKNAATPSPPTPKSVTLGVPTWEMQQTALNLLRQIDASRKQYQYDKGRLAGSVNDFIGVYIKAIRSVNGEDYSGLSMDPAVPLTVTMADGKSVTFDPTGANTTQIEIPPEEKARRQAVNQQAQTIADQVSQLQTQTQAATLQAVNAYMQANNGAKPHNGLQLLPYVAVSEDRAALAELTALMMQANANPELQERYMVAMAAKSSAPH